MVVDNADTLSLVDAVPLMGLTKKMVLMGTAPKAPSLVMDQANLWDSLAARLNIPVTVLD